MWIANCVRRTRDGVACVVLAVAWVLLGIPCLAAGLVFAAACIVSMCIVAIGIAAGGVVFLASAIIAPGGLQQLAKMARS